MSHEDASDHITVLLKIDTFRSVAIGTPMQKVEHRTSSW